MCPYVRGDRPYRLADRLDGGREGDLRLVEQRRAPTGDASRSPYRVRPMVGRDGRPATPELELAKRGGVQGARGLPAGLLDHRRPERPGADARAPAAGRA